MYKLFCLLVLCITSGICNSQTPDWAWAHAAGGNNTDEGRSVATDKDGNVLITGLFDDSITFDTNTFYQGGLFLVKYDSSGSVLWAQSVRRGTSNAVTTDLNGNIYITGGFVDSITFGTTTLYSSAPFTGFDVFTVKYDPAGHVLWAKAGIGESNDWGNGIAVDKNGNVFVTGDFGGDSLTFGAYTVTNSTWGSRDIFLVKYDLNGNVIWLKRPYGNYWDECYGIALDTNGNIFITGTFASSTLDFGTVSINSNSTYTFFVAKFNTNGNILWAKSARGIDYQYGYSVATDADGNAYLTGQHNGTIIFGSDTLRSFNFTSTDLFLVKYDQNGNIAWAHAAGGNGNEGGYAIAADYFGNIIVSGYFDSDSITFNGTTYFANNGVTNFFISKYDLNGNPVWATTAGGSSSAWASGIATDAHENTYITGKFQGQPISFGTISLNNQGWVDLFIAKLNSDTITSVSSSPYPIPGFRLFPNPATGILQLTLSDFPKGKAFSESYYLEILNLTGETVYMQAFQISNFQHQITLDVSKLTKGLYVYKVRNKDRVIKNGKIVKD